MAPTPPPGSSVRLPYGRDPLQFAHLRLPAGSGPHPVVMVIHGGYWRARHSLDYMDGVCAALTALGAATWSVEYRRIGNPGGGWPGTFQDVALAADSLRTLAPAYGLDQDRVVPLGHSAGGHLALWLAGRRRLPVGDPLAGAAPLAPRGVVSLAGVADLRLAWSLALSERVVETLLGGSPDAVPQRYASASPADLLPLGVPQVLIHGTDDEHVPFAIAQSYQRAACARGDTVDLIALPGMGHFEVVDPTSAAWPSVVGAVLPLLGIA